MQLKWNAADKDVVVLHQLPRARFCPGMSPRNISQCSIRSEHYTLNLILLPIGPKMYLNLVDGKSSVGQRFRKEGL